MTSERLCKFDEVQTDGETGRRVVRYDRESTPLSVAVPALVAECAGVDPVALPPMYDCIDVEALEALVQARPQTDRAVAVSFRYAGFTVGVDGTELSVQPVM